MSKRLDIVVFGATGVTGKNCIPFIAKYSKSDHRQLTWGIAGRSEKKLRDVLNHYGKDTGDALKDIPVIIADVQDENSLYTMARQARVIINCCGPFRFFGEAVVKACIQEGTHHVDVSGEIQFMEEMQLKYHKQAEEKGVYIISACGFDSIPMDLGTVFLQQKFAGTLNSVEAYLDIWEDGKSVKGSAINYGTWESIIYAIGHANELRGIRQKLFTNKLPTVEPKLETKILPRKSDVTHSWVIPFHTTDRCVVRRSQRYFYERESKRPVQIDSYFAIKSFIVMIQMIIGGLLFLALTKVSFGRNLLLKYPQLFTAGFITHDLPNEERAKNGRFAFTLYGEGWKEKLPSADYQYTTKPNTAIAAKIKGTNPGYGATCIFLVLSAMTIIIESKKMPHTGGVYPPGYAFAKTSLVEQINKNDGVKFEILYEKDLN